jgi:hypothetical protein
MGPAGGGIDADLLHDPVFSVGVRQERAEDLSQVPYADQRR